MLLARFFCIAMGVGCLLATAGANIAIKAVTAQDIYRSLLVFTVRGIPYRYRPSLNGAEYEYVAGKMQLHGRSPLGASVVEIPLYSIAGKYFKAEVPSLKILGSLGQLAIGDVSLQMEYLPRDGAAGERQTHTGCYNLNTAIFSVANSNALHPSQFELSSQLQ